MSRLGGAIGGASDRFEAQVIRRRSPLKSLSQASFEPCSNPLQTFPKPPWSPLKPSSPWSRLQAFLQPLKPFWRGPLLRLEAPLKPFSSPLEASLKPFWSLLEALLKPPLSPLRSLHLQAPFKPFSSPLEAPLKPFSSPLQAPLKPPWSSLLKPLKVPFKPLKASQRWSPLQAPLKPPWEGLEAPSSPPWSPPSSLLKVKGTVRFSLRILPAPAGICWIEEVVALAAAGWLIDQASVIARSQSF